jgi:hypothetical protein
MYAALVLCISCKSTRETVYFCEQIEHTLSPQGILGNCSKMADEVEQVGVS